MYVFLLTEPLTHTFTCFLISFNFTFNIGQAVITDRVEWLNEKTIEMKKAGEKEEKRRRKKKQ